jgi:hypothetical protein
LNTWAALRPDVLVVNLSNNDGPRSLEVNLTHLLEFNARERIATVLLLEANSSEVGPEKLGAKHRVVERLAREWKRPVWDLDGYLASDNVRDSGFLWWDFVHMTSWGHEVTAGWLAERIGPDLVAACADPSSR